MIYAISDVHAHTKIFNQFYQTLNKDDHVYVLGDVIDKGDGTIDVLKTILNDDRFTLLMGNHEYFFYSYLTGSSLDREYLRYQWFYLNDGAETFNSFLSLKKEERKKIIDKLLELPVTLSLNINNKKILLCHGCCHYPNNFYINNKDTKIYVKNTVWDRRISMYEDTIVIVGHTPTENRNIIKEENKNINGIWYNIDCGLARNDRFGRLGVLNLEDFSEKYFYDDDIEDIEIRMKKEL